MCYLLFMADPLCPETNVGMRRGGGKASRKGKAPLVSHPQGNYFPWFYPGAGSFPVTQPWPTPVLEGQQSQGRGDRAHNIQTHPAVQGNSRGQLSVSVGSCRKQNTRELTRNTERLFIGMECQDKGERLQRAGLDGI